MKPNISFNLVWVNPGEPQFISYQYESEVDPSLDADGLARDVDELILKYNLNGQSKAVTSVISKFLQETTLDKSVDDDLISDCKFDGQLTVGFSHPYASTDGLILFGECALSLRINTYIPPSNQSLSDSLDFCANNKLAFTQMHMDYGDMGPNVSVNAGSDEDTLLILSGWRHKLVFIREDYQYLYELLPKNVVDMIFHHDYHKQLTDISW